MRNCKAVLVRCIFPGNWNSVCNRGFNPSLALDVKFVGSPGSKRSLQAGSCEEDELKNKKTDGPLSLCSAENRQPGRIWDIKQRNEVR